LCKKKRQKKECKGQSEECSKDKLMSKIEKKNKKIKGLTEEVEGLKIKNKKMKKAIVTMEERKNKVEREIDQIPI